jgi:hypothetical protein
MSITRIRGIGVFIPVEPVAPVEQGRSSAGGQGRVPHEQRSLPATGGLQRLPEHLRLHGAPAPRVDLQAVDLPTPASETRAIVPTVLDGPQPGTGTGKTRKTKKTRQSSRQQPQPSYLKLARGRSR